MNLTLPGWASGTNLASFLTNKDVKDITTGALVSLLAAYAFYLMIDYTPRIKRKKQSLFVLESLIAAILDAYNRCRIFGHETPISHVNRDVLEIIWLDEKIKEAIDGKTTFLRLKFSMQTASCRLPDFRNTLILASNISPEHAFQWLIIIDKVRLFAEIYNSEQPTVSEDEIKLIDNDSEENPLLNYKRDLNLRFLELLEVTRNWRKSNNY